MPRPPIQLGSNGQIDSFPSEDLRLPVKRLVICKLGYQHMCEQIRGGQTTLDRPRRSRRLDNAITIVACELGADVAFRRDMIGSEKLQGIGKIDHLRNRGRLFKRVVPERKGNAGHLAVKTIVGIRYAAGDDCRFSIRRRMFDTDVETAPSDRISQPALFIASEYDERNAPGRDRSELGNGKRPGRQDFQERRFEIEPLR